MIKNESGQEFTNHYDKADIFWNDFRARMGTSVKTEMHYNLADFYGNGMTDEMKDSL